MSKESAMAMVNGAPVVDVLRGTSETVSQGTEISAPVAAPAPADAPKDLESSRFAQLAKKEARVVAIHEQAKAEKAAIEAEKAKLAIEQAKITEFENLRKTDPVAALKGLGFSETDIFNYLAVTEKKEPTPEEKAKLIAEEVLEVYKKEQAESAAKAQAQKDEQIVQKFKSDITSHVQANKDEFKFCAFKGPEADETIFNTILAGMELDPNLPPMTYQEATQLVENFYREQDEAMAPLRAPKPTPTVAAPVVEAPAKAEVSPRPGQRVVKTIPQSATATIASQAPGRKETASEKRERLIRKLANGGV